MRQVIRSIPSMLWLAFGALVAALLGAFAGRALDILVPLGSEASSFDRCVQAVFMTLGMLPVQFFAGAAATAILLYAWDTRALWRTRVRSLWLRIARPWLKAEDRDAQDWVLTWGTLGQGSHAQPQDTLGSERRQFRVIDVVMDAKHLERPAPYLDFEFTCFNGVASSSVTLLKALGRIRLQAEEFHAPIELHLDGNSPAPVTGLHYGPCEFGAFTIKARLDAAGAQYARAQLLKNECVSIAFVGASIEGMLGRSPISIELAFKIKVESATGKPNPPFVAQIRTQGLG